MAAVTSASQLENSSHAGVPVATVRLQDLLNMPRAGEGSDGRLAMPPMHGEPMTAHATRTTQNAAERHSAVPTRRENTTSAAGTDHPVPVRNLRGPEIPLPQQHQRQPHASEHMMDLNVDHLFTYSEQASSARSSANGSSAPATGKRQRGATSGPSTHNYADPQQLSITERLSHAETAASLAKRRNKSPQSQRRRHSQHHNPHSALGEHPEKDVVVQHERPRSSNKSSETQGQPTPRTSSDLRVNGNPLPPPQQVLSSALSSSSMILARRKSEVALPRDVSPSVVLLGVGTSLDQKRIALSNAELRRQLRILKQQNQKHEAERQRIEHVQRSDDTIDGIQRDAEMLGEQIAQAAEAHAALAAEMELLSQQKDELQQQVKAERWTRNSVQRVLFDRSDSFKEWKRAVALEKQRREESRINEILQRQMAAASAGDRRIRPVREVRQERDELRELVQTLRGEKSDLEAALQETGRDIEEAKVRAQSLLAADDEVEERMEKLKVYMATVKKVLGE